MVAVRIERLKIGFAVDWTLSGEGRSTFELVSRLGLGASVARGGAYDLKTRLTAGRNRWPEPLAGVGKRQDRRSRSGSVQTSFLALAVKHSAGMRRSYGSDASGLPPSSLRQYLTMLELAKSSLAVGT